MGRPPGLVRDALIARGLKGAALKGAEQEFATSALSHARAALRPAYALTSLRMPAAMPDGPLWIPMRGSSGRRWWIGIPPRP